MSLGPQLQFVDRHYVQFESRKLLYLAGIDYHRMSNHPAILKAAKEAIEKFGLNATGSRTTTGNHPLYAQLERSVAEFFGSEGAVVCPSGYLTNTMVLQAIGCEYDVFFIDDKAHSSLIDAANQCGKEIYRFEHLQAQNLEEQLKKHLPAGAKPLVLTDGVFPARGEMPPLKDYAKIIESYNGKILTDDAHAMAVIGPNGKGTWEYAGIDRNRIYQTGTLSKGFGIGGGIVPGDSDLIEKIHSRSLAFVGSTGLTLPLAAAAIESVAFINAHKDIITDIQSRTLALKKRFKDIGLMMPETPAPILSITHNDVEKNQRLRDLLLDNGIYPPFINYPGAPAGGHFRFILISTITKEQEALLFDVIKSSL